MVAYGLESTLQLQATTGLAGFALQNATPNILTWTAPGDGQLHRVYVFASLHVTAAETGGVVGVAATVPDGAAFNAYLVNQNLAIGTYGAGLNGANGLIVKGGTTVYLKQETALIGGAATLWAEIWGR